jgi:hypothetical protein
MGAPARLVEQLRKHAAYIGASYGLIDQMSGLGEGSTNKYLSPARVRQFTILSLSRVASVLALKAMLVVDAALMHQVQPSWGECTLEGPPWFRGRRCKTAKLTLKPEAYARFVRCGRIKKRRAESKQAFTMNKGQASAQSGGRPRYYLCHRFAPTRRILPWFLVELCPRRAMSRLASSVGTPMSPNEPNLYRPLTSPIG